MAVVTKFKIYKTGKMEAGEFVEDANAVSLKMNSEAHVNELDEMGENVKFTSNGGVVATEFEEV